jgi:hypothetical protein
LGNLGRSQDTGENERKRDRKERETEKKERETDRKERKRDRKEREPEKKERETEKRERDRKERDTGKKEMGFPIPNAQPFIIRNCFQKKLQKSGGGEKFLLNTFSQ